MKTRILPLLAALVLMASFVGSGIYVASANAQTPQPPMVDLSGQPVYNPGSSSYLHMGNATSEVVHQLGDYLFGYTNANFFQCDVFGGACWGEPTYWSYRNSNTSVFIYAAIYNVNLRQYVVYQATVVGTDINRSISGSTVLTGGGTY